MSNSYHVASVIVRAFPEQIVAVEQRINALAGVEVHQRADNGKLVVTIESDSHKGISAATDLIYDIESVVDVSAVYHEYMENA